MPVLAEMKGWLDKNLSLVSPKSALGKAVAYMLSNWKRLIRYTDDGRLEIDKNLTENKIRPVALGCKNYLFAGSHNDARWAATIYSLVGTARLYQLDQFAYLRDVFSRISDHPYKKLDELLPPKLTPLQ